MTKRDVVVIRVYDDPGRQGDEYRVLVDRLWPRGRPKASVDHDEWVKVATPSIELRRWYQHDPERFSEFARRYRSELAQQPAADVVTRLRKVSTTRQLILLTATRDVDHSGAKALSDVIRGARGS